MKKSLLHATLVDKNTISIIYIPNYSGMNDVDFYLVSGKNKKLLEKEIHLRQTVSEIKLISEVDILLGQEYFVESSDLESIPLDLDEYISSEEFDELYSYDGDDLGPTYHKKSTTFKFWSPLSIEVFLKIEKKDNKFLLYKMNKEDRGIFSLTLNGDLENKKYCYVANVNGKTKEMNDPYAKGTSLNSKYSAVVDLNKVKELKNIKPVTKFKKYNEAIIYELNIRDFTEKANVKHPGTYIGMIEKIPYLKKLGITHVQLLPVLDFDRVDDIKKDTYNWGYDPLSFFALEGSYSLNPSNPLTRLIEFKTLVNELHKNDIRVVLDVVYNHLYDYKNTDFQRNVPYYYFRTYKNKMCNASGCGNDFACERKMARKIILDSVRYLLKVFDVDGFRFDLLGLIDVDTTNMIIAEAKNIKKDVILYGEGWHMGTNLPEEKKSSTLNADKIPGMAFFNDTFRDLVKGATFGNEAGYISGNLEYKNQVEFVMSGSIFNDKFDTPLQSINYVECHDNQTLYDKLFTISGDKEVVLRELKLANAITIFSLGIPFIHMGQEIGLSKFSLDNTYNVKNVNNMDWNLVEERKDLVNYTADLIKLRKKLTIFKMNNEEEISDTLDFFQLENGLLNITIRNKKYLLGHKKALIIINPTHENRNVEFDDYFSILFGTAGLEDKKIKIKHYLSSGTSFILFVLD